MNFFSDFRALFTNTFKILTFVIVVHFVKEIVISRKKNCNVFFGFYSTVEISYLLSVALVRHQQRPFFWDPKAVTHLRQSLHRSTSRALFERVCPLQLDLIHISTICHRLEYKHRLKLVLTIRPVIWEKVKMFKIFHFGENFHNMS